MTIDELIPFIKRERDKVNWQRKHIPFFKQHYDMEDKLYRAIGILQLRAEPKPKLVTGLEAKPE
jgi:hypothetical protein